MLHKFLCYINLKIVPSRSKNKNNVELKSDILENIIIYKIEFNIYLKIIMNINQYHHYIPRFILKNFSIDKNKEDIKIYNINEDEINISKIKKSYGIKNMYKDLDEKDVMYVEKKISKFESICANIINKIKKEDNVININRQDVENIKKIFFIMTYRHKSRRDQYLNDNFDFLTKKEINDFMKKQKIKTLKDVWLNNIKQILDTDHEKIQDNEKIFFIIRNDYFINCLGTFISIWKIEDESEFILTDNCFSVFEGAYPIVIYHSFFIVSPKIVIVFANIIFKKGHDSKLYNKEFGVKPTFFNESFGTEPNVEYFVSPKIPNKKDNFVYNIKKINKNTTYLVNSLFLNEIKNSLTYISENFLYESITKYYEIDLSYDKKDFTKLKEILNKKLNIQTSTQSSSNILKKIN